jgi:hypothetical protein
MIARAKCKRNPSPVPPARPHEPVPPRSAPFSAYDGVVPARGKALLKTDIAIVVPPGTYGRVGESDSGGETPHPPPPLSHSPNPRSPQPRARAWPGRTASTSAPASSVRRAKDSSRPPSHLPPPPPPYPPPHPSSPSHRPDEDYRGNVGVILFNHSDVDFPVKAGDRVAQLILERLAIAEVAVVDELSETERGAGGFGSTGVTGTAPAAAAAAAAAAPGSADKKQRTE